MSQDVVHVADEVGVHSGDDDFVESFFEESVAVGEVSAEVVDGKFLKFFFGYGARHLCSFQFLEGGRRSWLDSGEGDVDAAGSYAVADAVLVDVVVFVEVDVCWLARVRSFFEAGGVVFAVFSEVAGVIADDEECEEDASDNGDSSSKFQPLL